MDIHTKTCENCGQVFNKRVGETLYDWKKRCFCSRHCVWLVGRVRMNKIRFDNPKKGK